MSVKITLPGSIPVLLRRGSPVITNNCLKALCLDDGVINNSKHVCILIEEKGTVRTSFHETDRVFLDLEDPTGRQHAIWWLAENATNEFGLLTYDSLNCVYWDHMEYARYAIRAERAPDDWDSINLIIAFSLNVKSSYDVHIAEFESLKNTPVELMSAKALQIVCLHVAKERGML